MNQSQLALESAPTVQCSNLEPGPNDAILLQNAQNGDAEALESLICRHRPAFFRHAKHACGDPTAAEDICQEACLKAILKLPCLAMPSNFRGWVFGIIDNEAMHLKRNLKIVCTRSEAIGTNIVETMIAETAIDSQEQTETLLGLLGQRTASMPARLRGVALFMIDHYRKEQQFPTVRAIAQATHTSQGAAQLHRRAVLAYWRHILTACELDVPSLHRAVL